MDLQLKDKLALITGSTKGIGEAVAKGLAREGARVVVNGRSRDDLDRILKELPDTAQGIAGDLSTAAGCHGLIEAVEQIGQPDILINNVGIFEVMDFFDIPEEKWELFFQLNVMSGVRLSRAFMPGMLERNWGRILFTSSESGLNIPEEMIHYGMTKTAMLAVSRGLAQLTKGTDVTVNSVLPGPTWSEGVSQFVEKFARKEGMETETFKAEVFFEEARPTSIIQRFASPEEVANMFVYLCSPLAAATNGGALRVDGGTVRSIIP